MLSLVNIAISRTYHKVPNNICIALIHLTKTNKRIKTVNIKPAKSHYKKTQNIGARSKRGRLKST